MAITDIIVIGVLLVAVVSLVLLSGGTQESQVNIMEMLGVIRTRSIDS